MLKSTSVIEKFGDSRSLLNEVLNSSARLYRIKVIEEVGKVYFFFNPPDNKKSRSWRLSLFICPGVFRSARDINFGDFLRRTVKQELRGLNYPDKIDVILPYVLEGEASKTCAQLARQPLNNVVDLVEVILPDWNLEDFRASEVEELKEVAHLYKVRPAATNFLIILISLVFLIQTTMAFIDPDFLRIGWIGVNSLNMAMGNYFGILAGTFIHGNFVHFAMNIFALYYLGLHLSRFFNFSNFILIYAISTTSGILGSLAFAQANSIGSSGAIFGLLGALLVCLWKAQPKAQIDDYWNFQFQCLLRSLHICLILSTVIPLIVPRIDVWGHFGGLLGGLFISYLLSNINFSYKVGSLIILFCLGVPLFKQLQYQNSWATKILTQRQEHRAAAKRLVIELNGRLADITHYIKIFLDFQAEDVQALHSERVDSMRANFEFIKQRQEFTEQNLLQSYFDCIDEGLQNLTIPRKQGYKVKWLKNYSRLEKELMQHYGLARSEDI